MHNLPTTVDERSMKRLYNLIIERSPFNGDLTQDELKIQKEKELINFLLRDFINTALIFEVDNELLKRFKINKEASNLKNDQKKNILMQSVRIDMIIKFEEDRKKTKNRVL